MNIRRGLIGGDPGRKRRTLPNAAQVKAIATTLQRKAWPNDERYL
jgi:hypothetical protein